MADNFQTLADLLKIDTAGASDIDVSDLLNKAQIINRIAAGTASNGTQHQYLKEIGAPVVGFRDPNTGRDVDKSSDELVTINLKILSANTMCDKALADVHKKGPGAFVAREARRHLRQAFFEAEKQMLYGTGNIADGFTGLVDNASVATLAGEMVIDAGGTTPGTASSVWFIVTNDDETDVTAIAGQDGNIDIGDTIVTKHQDANGKSYPVYYTPIESWLGLQIGCKYSVGRIVNVTEDAGKGLTDDLLSQMLELFPSDKQPSLIGMSRRSRGQLQRSRTTYSPTGQPAPLPSEYEGIPIVVAESIPNTEALVA